MIESNVAWTATPIPAMSTARAATVAGDMPG
jgi:hypothetical protein